MLCVQAEGVDSSSCWSHEIPVDEEICIGRAPRDGLAVPWDLRISREHITVKVHDDQIEVSKLSTALNPVLHRDQPKERFRLSAGDSFSIGNTTFRITGDAADQFIEYSYDRHSLDSVDFDNPALCLDLLARLPEQLERPQTEAQLADAISHILIGSLHRAAVTAIVKQPAGCDPIVLGWASRDTAMTRFVPSKAMVAKALETKLPLLHFWNTQETMSKDGRVAEDALNNSQFTTMGGELDCACCVPITTDLADPWCIYTAGIPDPALNQVPYRQDIKLMEVIARFLAAIRQRESRLSSRLAADLDFVNEEISTAT